MRTVRTHPRARTAILFVLLAVGACALAAAIIFRASFIERHLVADRELGVSNRLLLGSLRWLGGIVGTLLLIVAISGLIWKDAFARWLSARRQLFIGLLTMLVTLVVIAAFGEVVVRLTIGRETHGIGGEDPGTLRLTRSIPRNSEGFRDEEWMIEKPAGVFRILFLGDSFTFGSGVPETDSLIVNDLERILNARCDAIRFDAINAGHPGWNTKQELDFLEGRGIELQPDIVILAYVLNDAEEENTAYRELRFLPDPYERWIKSRSYLYYFVESRAHRLFERLHLVSGYGDYLAGLYDPGRPYLREHERYLAEIVETSRRNGAEVVFLIWPILFEMETYRFRAAHEFVRAVAAENDVPLLDLLDVYRWMDPDDLIVNPYNYHPNARAHTIAAWALARKLAELDLLPPCL